MAEQHFLEELSKKKAKDSLLNSVEENVNNISEERMAIGKKIQELLEEGYTKKEVLEIVSQKTLIPTQSISSMIEEFVFNKEFDLKTSLNFNEIKIVKKIFKNKKFNFEEKKRFLQQPNLKHLLGVEFENITNENKKTYKHTVSFDEEGELLFRNLKESLEKKLGKKISNNELVFYAMIELYNSNPDEILDEIDNNLDL